MSSIRTQTHKLIVRGTAERPVFDTFDVRADPREASPLAWDHRAVGLHAKQERWTAFWERTRARKAESLEIDAEHEAQLRALGYLDGDGPPRGDPQSRSSVQR
jgi:hypothetical protein